MHLLHAGAGNVIDALAAQVGLSRSRLSHAFSQYLGQSLNTYRSRCRLQAFDAARRSSLEQDLGSIAIACGFKNYMQCYRTHKRLRGSPPSAQPIEAAPAP